MVLHVLVHLQIGSGTRGDVTIQPTLVINNRQYRGRLDNKAVLKAICSGFKEGTEPALCLSYGQYKAWQDGWVGNKSNGL
ncbi:hypothetical protein HanOQP8_Chr01g0000371 [Helianthus annuus]|nr:hypothetical protein HanOQP8_Chr01g0000371 [Helianthus annuus]